MSDFRSYITWEEFNNPYVIRSEYEETNILCPVCGKPVYKFTGVALTTFPVMFRYECKECDWIGLSNTGWVKGAQ